MLLVLQALLLKGLNYHNPSSFSFEYHHHSSSVILLCLVRVSSVREILWYLSRVFQRLSTSSIILLCNISGRLMLLCFLLVLKCWSREKFSQRPNTPPRRFTCAGVVKELSHFFVCSICLITRVEFITKDDICLAFFVY